MKKLCTIWSLLPALSLLGCSGGPTPEGADVVGSVEGELLSGALPYRGVNLAGAEFAVDTNGNGPLPGTHGVDYIYPDPHYAVGYNSAAYFVGKGMTTFRLPFRWERLQQTRKAPFNAAEQARLTTTVDGLLAKGAAVLLDPHNYGRYGTSVIGSGAVPNSDFADFWQRLASLYKGNSKVVFGIMNEPHDMSTEQWVGAANAAIAAIRSTGATNLIVVPGNGWDGADSWSWNWYGTPNATAMLQIKDPGNNYAYEVHQYLDDSSSGTSPNCTSSTIGSQRLAGFTNWLHANGRRGFLGEFNGGRGATCLAALDDMLKHMEANSDVWLGWTFWAAGPWWGSDVIEPINGADDVRMTMMLPHLSWAGGSGGGSGSGGGVCTAATYEAETMSHSTGSASPGGWNLWTNGNVATNHTFVAGPTHITVTAKGDAAVNVWPHMVVTVDGTQVGQANVATNSWSSYSFAYAATAGAHQIKVTFDNDYYANGQDRNLYVDKVAVTCN
jgi:endoglucanase